MISVVRALARRRIVQLSVAVLASVSLQACSQESEAVDAFQESYNRNFKASFATSFVASCTGAGTANGVSVNEMASICKCASDELVSKYEVSELASLSSSPEKGLPIMRACAQKLGFMPRPNAATGAP